MVRDIGLSGAAVFFLAGLCCAWVSDVLFLLRFLVFRGKLAGFILDFLLMAVCALVIFLTIVSVLQENLRGYQLFSFAAAAFLWERTAGQRERKLAGRIRSARCARRAGQ